MPLQEYYRFESLCGRRWNNMQVGASYGERILRRRLLSEVDESVQGVTMRIFRGAGRAFQSPATMRSLLGIWLIALWTPI